MDETFERRILRGGLASVGGAAGISGAAGGWLGSYLTRFQVTEEQLLLPGRRLQVLTAAHRPSRPGASLRRSPGRPQPVTRSVRPGS